MDIKRDKNGEEIITTVIGDFIIRWGVFTMVGGLLFAAAMNAKDFEKNRLKQLTQAGNFIQEKKDKIKTICLNEIKEIMSTDIENKNVKYDLIKLSENSFKIEDKKDIFLYSKNKNLFFQIKLCEKQLEELNRMELNNE